MLKVSTTKGRALLFLVSRKNLNLSFGALKIIKNEIELRKLCPPKIEGVKNSINKPSNVTKVGSETPKRNLFMLLYCY
jgi:hypothetical protein